MRFWRRPTPGPVSGPDPGADAVAEETENRKSEDETAVADLHPAPLPESDASEKNSAEEIASSNADREDRRQWSSGFWRRAEPAPDPEEPAELAAIETAPAQFPPAGTEAQERGWFARLKRGWRAARSG